MITLKLSPDNFKKIIEIAVKSIKEGEILICPTDTVYGLICDATNKETIKKLFKLKRRPKTKPIPIFVRNIKTAKKLVKVNSRQEKFLKKIWPGKITAVLKRKKKAKIYGVGKETIALRIPNYKFINQLLSILNSPLTGTSANISGQPASTKIKEVLKQFRDLGKQPDLAIDAGNLGKSKPSTIINLTTQSPKILRE